MTLDEFDKAIRNGLGRVIQHLQHNDATPFQEIILHVRLHRTSYDPVVEGYKAQYLKDIIELTPNHAFYRDQILRTTSQIDEDTNNRDAWHLVELTTAFAISGDDNARQIVYDIFENFQETFDGIAIDSIIEIDGLDGFLRIIKAQEEDIMSSDEDDLSYPLACLEEIFSEEVATAKLEILRKEDDLLDRYLSNVSTNKASRSQRQSVVRERISSIQNKGYADIKELLEKNRMSIESWAATASDEDLILAARDLISITDPNKVMPYLRLFKKRVFPLEPKHLFRFMNMEHEYISIPAVTLRVLQQIKHPAVRDFALRLISGSQYSARAIRLLTHNFQEGDWKLIESVSHSLTTEDELHSYGFAVQDVFKINPDETAIPTLLFCYENTPCSSCRRNIVEMLHSLSAVTQGILHECQFDSNLDIREWAKSHLNNDET